MNQRFIHKIFSILFIAGFVFVSACAVNPVTGKKQLSFMSESQEIALGAQNDPIIVQQYGLYENEALQKFINEKGAEMVAVSHRPNLKFTFRILDSPVVNAFALPGGYVYFTRGILGHFNNEAEFAGVLGHEIGHVTARHSAEQYTNQILSQVLLIGGLIVSKELRTFANEAQTALGLLSLKYSRDNESQSDELGVAYSSKIGYDARKMAHFFRTLKSMSADAGGEIPTFLSTHPDPADRERKVDDMAVAYQAESTDKNFKVNQDSYLRMIDGLIYGDDPKQGYVEGGVFYHPELKFQFPIPSGWNYQNSPAQFQMVSQDGEALMILTLANGNNLQAAANQTNQDLQLETISSRQVTINGLNALEVKSQQVTQDGNTGQQSVLAVQSHYIQYGGNIYVIHGASPGQIFSKHEPTFDKTSGGFKELKDPSKINVKPERIKIIAASQKGTLEQNLLAAGQPAKELHNLEILNGMTLKDQVEKGRLIKILVK